MGRWYGANALIRRQVANRLAGKIAGDVRLLQVAGSPFRKERLQVGRPQNAAFDFLEVECTGTGMVTRKIERAFQARPQSQRPVSNKAGKTLLAPSAKGQQHYQRIGGIRIAEAQQST